MSLFSKLKDTKFKSLKYGDDSFGGGDSLEPIIQKPIRNNNPQGVQTPVQDVALENQSRISYLLNKTNRGSKFIQNQRSLQLSNTRIESTPDNISKRTRINPLIYYNPQNTLIQIGRNPAEQGEHYSRFGVTPFMDDSLKYTSVVARNSQENNNRLLKLHNKLQVGTLPTTTSDIVKDRLRNNLNSLVRGTNLLAGIFNIFGGNQIINKINSKVNQVVNTIIPVLTPENRIIDEYNGGPGSLYGAVGTTKIRRFDYTNDASLATKIKDLGKSRLNAKRNLLTGFGNRPDPEKTKLGTSLLFGNDATKGYENKSEIKNSVYNITTDLTGNKIYDDIFLKNQKQTSAPHTVLEKPTSDFRGFYQYKTSKKNPINIKNGNQINWINSKLNAYNDTTIDDISDNSKRMPIRFDLIDAFTGNSKEKLSFSAYINGFKDTSSPEYSDIKYIGRSEHFYVYTGFKRDVSFNFQIPCYNFQELRSKHTSLATLMSSTMGQYNDTKLGGVICKLKLGNYINNQPGFITNISYDVPNDSSWDIDEQLAHNINVSVGFTLIHDFLPSFNNSGSIFTIGGELRSPLSINEIRTAVSSLPVGLSAIPNINIQRPF
jgi:hypothetical protein